MEAALRLQSVLGLLRDGYRYRREAFWAYNMYTAPQILAPRGIKSGNVGESVVQQVRFTETHHGGFDLTYMSVADVNTYRIRSIRQVRMPLANLGRTQVPFNPSGIC